MARLGSYGVPHVLRYVVMVPKIAAAGAVVDSRNSVDLSGGGGGFKVRDNFILSLCFCFCQDVDNW